VPFPQRVVFEEGPFRGLVRQEQVLRPTGGLFSPLTRARLTAESRVVPSFRFGDPEPFIDAEFRFFADQLRGKTRSFVGAVVPGISRYICFILNCSEDTVSETLAVSLGEEIAGAHVSILLPVIGVPGGATALRELVDFEIELAVGRDRLADVESMRRVLQAFRPTTAFPGVGGGRASPRGERLIEELLKKLEKAETTIIKNRRRAPARR